MNNPSWKKIIDHPDKDEIISKLIIGISPKDVYSWLDDKYNNISEAKFVISEKYIKTFQTTYLDFYTTIKEDFSKTRTALVAGTEDQLELSVKNNPAYKDIIIDTVNKELDLKNTISKLCVAVETRLGQIHDTIQEDPRDINTKIDRIFIEYVEVLGGLLEKAYKIINNGPDQIIQHNITVQHLDQHISVFYSVIKKVLEQMDLESSMYFMERFNQEMAKIREPLEKPVQPVDERLAEVKILNETINQKINEIT